jgi:two-component system, NtrC family, response regulator HydG
MPMRMSLTRTELRDEPMESKGSILIVDDNEGLCRTLSLILRRHGYDVTIALDGFRAIQASRDHSFDLIFMDIRMPELNGVETFKRVRSFDPEVSVMMMTAFEMEDLKQEALDAGALGIMNKPFEITRMMEIVEGVCSGSADVPVLVVDDDESTRHTLGNILTKHGYQVHLASSGEEAVEMVRTGTFQVAFLDMKMPGINGLETYLAIREIDQKITAIIITGFHNDLEDLVNDALTNTAFTCFDKPLNMDRLLSLTNTIAMRKLLDLPMTKPGAIPGN